MSDMSLSLAADGSALPSLFFRAADRLRLEGCVAAICREGRSLALSSLHEAALDHYGELLVSRLRQAAPSAQLEVYFPANTDAMLTRFNEALAARSLRQAMDEQVQAPEHIWLVHDAGALAEHELQLLARLVTNFPGAKIRVVLLLGASQRSRKAFDSLGRRIVRWDVEGPTPEQADAMLSQARNDGCEGLVAELLQKIQPGLRPARPVPTRDVTDEGLKTLGSLGADASTASPFARSAHDVLSSRHGAKAVPLTHLTTASSWEVLANVAPRGKLAAASGFLRLLAWQKVLALVSAVAGRAVRHGPRSLLGLVGKARQRAGLITVVAVLGLGSVAVASFLHPTLFGRKPNAAQPLQPTSGSKDVRADRVMRLSASLLKNFSFSL